VSSRRGSRTDSMCTCSDGGGGGANGAGGGLACEPSSYGVCGDPAGAVHLLAPAIPDKLARLKQRLPGRHITADGCALAPVAAAVAAASGRGSGDEDGGGAQHVMSSRPR
jgi:hypothetical protein